jgi:galactokinase
MYQVVNAITHNLPDVEVFIDTLNRLDQKPSAAIRTLFNPNDELFVTRAPGRLDVMGGIADYSGSLVLELPIAEATLIALQRSDERTLKIVSLTDDAKGSISFEMPSRILSKTGNQSITRSRANTLKMIPRITGPLTLRERSSC